MAADCEIDDLDRRILAELQRDARMPFQEIARKLMVSGGTVHVRVGKLREQGVVKSFRVVLDADRLGYEVCAFVGINLHKARDHKRVTKRLLEMPEVLEAHYTTGTFSLFVKVMAQSTRGLHDFLVDRLQPIPEIQSTETLVSLRTLLDRDVPVSVTEP